MIILDIELPENCKVCPFRICDMNHHNVLLGELIRIDYCIARERRKMDIYTVYGERPEWCPIKAEITDDGFKNVSKYYDNKTEVTVP